jgi:uncharacterized membrane protein
MSEPPSNLPPPRGVVVHPTSTTLGERAADGVARTIGSWRFIIIQSTLLLIWVALNGVGWMRHWDPYPFILMNLMLSLQAAYSGPIIMMSQNRMSEHDRMVAQKDFRMDSRAEHEVRLIMAHLERQDEMIAEIRDRLRDMDQPDRPGSAPSEPLPRGGSYP